jgi:hypothetical protein
MTLRNKTTQGNKLIGAHLQLGSVAILATGYRIFYCVSDSVIKAINAIAFELIGISKRIGSPHCCNSFSATIKARRKCQFSKLIFGQFKTAACALGAFSVFVKMFIQNPLGFRNTANISVPTTATTGMTTSKSAGSCLGLVAAIAHTTPNGKTKLMSANALDYCQSTKTLSNQFRYIGHGSIIPCVYL